MSFHVRILRNHMSNDDKSLWQGMVPYQIAFTSLDTWTSLGKVGWQNEITTCSVTHWEAYWTWHAFHLGCICGKPGHPWPRFNYYGMCQSWSGLRYATTWIVIGLPYLSKTFPTFESHPLVSNAKQVFRCLLKWPPWVRFAAFAYKYQTLVLCLLVVLQTMQPCRVVAHVSHMLCMQKEFVTNSASQSHIGVRPTYLAASLLV